MKLTHMLMKERIQALGTLSLQGDRFDMSYEAGIVTVVPSDGQAKGRVFLVPLSNVVGMEATPTPAKK